MNPGGGTASARGWKEEWTNDFNQCFDSLGSNLHKIPPDMGDYCSKDDPKEAYRAVFVALAGKESAYNPHARGQNGGRVPAGLFQMDSQDMRSHRCPGTNPMDAQQNLCCAVKIADNLARKGATKLADHKHGIMDAFWQPMRDGTGGNGRGGHINNTAVHTDLKRVAKLVCESGESAANGTGGGGGSYSRRRSSRKARRR